MTRIPPHKSILIVRLSAIGDVVMATPIASLLKRHYPDSYIAWIVQPECAELLIGNPAIDEVIIWDRKRWRQLLKSLQLKTLAQEIRQFSSHLRAQKFELALDLQGLLKSGFLAWLSNAKARIGLGSTEGSHRFMNKTISRNMGEQTLIGAEYRYMLNQLGVSDSPWQMNIPIPDHVERKCMTELNPLLNGESYLVACPFTTRPQKHWLDDYWQQVILRIRGRYKLRTILLGGPGDEERASKIAAKTGAISLAGKTSLIEAATIIKNASLLIGVDTGLTHMGHAFRTPTLALFGSTCPYSFAGVETSKVIYQDMWCSPCRRNPTCKGKYTCMRDITPDIVLAELKPLMKYQNENSAH